MDEPVPAPRSISTSCPCRFRRAPPAGVIATLYSWFLISRGTPISTVASCARHVASVLRVGCGAPSSTPTRCTVVRSFIYMSSPQAGAGSRARSGVPPGDQPTRRRTVEGRVDHAPAQPRRAHHAGEFATGVRRDGVPVVQRGGIDDERLVD